MKEMNDNKNSKEELTSFGLINYLTFKMKVMSVILIVSMLLNIATVSLFVYLMSNFEFTKTITETHETLTFDGDLNEYNNSNDNRNITNNYGKEAK